MHQKLHLNFGGYSDAGLKALNQDAFTASMPSEHSVRKYKGGVACIADGASCSDNAQLASQTAVTNFISDYYSTPDFWTVKQSAAKVISSVNSWLYQQGVQSHTQSNGFVSTFSALVIKSHTAHLLHAGDSRIYLLRDSQLELLTRDHRYRRGNDDVLVRALGIEPQLELDYSKLKVQLGDRFMLTTDGIHDTLSSDELRSMLAQGGSLEDIAKGIAQTALAKGSKDNLSCLLVDIDSLPIERVDELHQSFKDLTIPPALNVGNKIDHFEIVRTLHSGPRSHVYLARDKRNDDLCVLKMPSINFSEDSSYLEAFAREQWIGRKLNDSRIMKIYAPLTNSHFLYHHCQYLKGTSLRQWMIDNPKPPLQLIRHIVSGMIQSVRVLHRSKMVHRDLKPENFIIDRDNNISLIDFGTIKIAGIEEISSTEKNTTPVGDAKYIAPETALYNHSNAGTDLFSIAIIVYEMLAEELPFDAIQSNRVIPNSSQQWHYRPLNKLSNTREDIPTWVNSVLEKALSLNPNSRYQAMSEFMQDLHSPSREILRSVNQRPLIERNPLRFWKGLSLILFMLIFYQWWLLIQR